MNLQEIIKDQVKLVYDLKKQKEELEAKKAEIDSQIKKLDDEISKNSSELTTKLSEEDCKEIRYNDLDLVITLEAKESKIFDDVQALKYLKEHNLLDCIKVVESIKKQELNKLLKQDIKLDEALKSMYSIKSTPYIVVTNFENDVKRKEHIAEALNGK